MPFRPPLPPPSSASPESCGLSLPFLSCAYAPFWLATWDRVECREFSAPKCPKGHLQCKQETTELPLLHSKKLRPQEGSPAPMVSPRSHHACLPGLRQQSLGTLHCPPAPSPHLFTRHQYLAQKNPTPAGLFLLSEQQKEWKQLSPHPTPHCLPELPSVPLIITCQVLSCTPNPLEHVLVSWPLHRKGGGKDAECRSTGIFLYRCN